MGQGRVIGSQNRGLFSSAVHSCLCVWGGRNVAGLQALRQAPAKTRLQTQGRGAPDELHLRPAKPGGSSHLSVQSDICH